MNTNIIIRRRSITRVASQLTSKPQEPNNANSIFTLCSLGKLNEALQALFSQSSPSPTSAAYSSILQLCIDSRAKPQGVSLQDHILATGHSPDLNLSIKLIVFHSKIAKDLASAREVFDRMPETSVVSWTAMISGYSQNGFPEEALKMFVEMRRFGFNANQFTYGSTLQACTKMGGMRIGEQIQGCLEKSGFCGDVCVQGALLDLHLKRGSVEDARGLFERMEWRDVVSWNSMIGGYAVRGMGDDAFRFFRSMLRDDMLPDDFTLANVLRASGSTEALCNVNQTHAFIIKLGHCHDPIVTGSLIDAYAKCRRMCSARLVYDSSLKHDLISCTALINGYSLERGSNKEALDIFYEINKKGMKLDDFILCSMLNVCANLAALSLGRQIHACIVKNQCKHDVALGNAIIDMYAKTGELKGAHQAFDEMPQKNVISWTSLIMSYGKHGYGDDAISLFAKMKDVGVKPNDVTFLSLLFACSHSGLTSKGIELFNSMSKYGIDPKAKHYTCIVDLLARGGFLREAYDVAYNMNVKPNTSLWGSLLGACSVHGNASLAKITAANLFNLDPKKHVNYVVLSNIYAAAGLWEYASKTRDLIEERSTKKIAASSFV